MHYSVGPPSLKLAQHCTNIGFNVPCLLGDYHGLDRHHRHYHGEITVSTVNTNPRHRRHNSVSPLAAAVTSSSQHSTIIMIIYKAPWLSPSPLDATLDSQSDYMMQTNYSLTLTTLKYCSDSYVLVSFFRLI